jgi:hypothetical protein
VSAPIEVQHVRAGGPTAPLRAASRASPDDAPRTSKRAKTDDKPRATKRVKRKRAKP